MVCVPLRVEVREVEDRARAGHGHPLPFEHGDRRRQHEALDDDVRGPGDEAGHQPPAHRERPAPVLRALVKAWTDEEFRRKFLADPKAQFEEHLGTKLPDNLVMTAYQEDANHLCSSFNTYVRNSSLGWGCGVP